MWIVEEITAIPVELDFSSSSQGRCVATKIEAAGVRLFNAIERVDVEPTATQVEVCEGCGYSHCAPGGWVALRRIGDHVVWLPAWDEMERGAWEESEYGPPSFLRTKGAPVFGPTNWERLRALHAGLPACASLPGINSREAVRLCQWSAPGRILGEYPLEPRLRRDLVITVTDGGLAEEATTLDACLRAYFGTERQMAFAPGHAAVRPIEFWLDLPGTPGWSRFAHVENEVCVLIDGGPAIIFDGG